MNTTTTHFTPFELTTPALAANERTEDALEQALQPALATYRETIAALRPYVPFALLDALDIQVDDLLRAAYEAGYVAGWEPGL